MEQFFFPKKYFWAKICLFSSKNVIFNFGLIFEKKKIKKFEIVFHSYVDPI
jgi:hypothetical protein